MRTPCMSAVSVCIMRTALTRPSSSLSKPCAWLLTTKRLDWRAEWVYLYATAASAVVFQPKWLNQIKCSWRCVSSSSSTELCDDHLLQNAKALKAKKEEGNKVFKEGNYEAAYDLYSEALTIDPNNIKTNAKLYCNRATVGSKVKDVHRTDICLHLGRILTV